jgi:hypothetical protein
MLKYKLQEGKTKNVKYLKQTIYLFININSLTLSNFMENKQ